MTKKPKIETRFERGLFASRRLMAPMYLGLIVALAMLAIVLVCELIYYVPQVFSMSVEDVILTVLTLVDLTLAGNLLLIALFSGYEISYPNLTAAKPRTGPHGWERSTSPGPG
jgi:uncharacterized protein (TIGR00645 family)